MFCIRKVGLLAGAVALATMSHAQLRVATWNVTNYDGTDRANDFKTSFYGTFEGRSFAPDAIIGQEFLSQTSVNTFVTVLNTAPGSPGDWAAATFVNGADTDSAFFYRTSKLTLLGTTTVSVGSSATSNHPRNIMRYDVRIKGYSGAGATIAMYSTHMKAGSTTDDFARRLIEAQKIRDNIETLPAGWHAILGGDLNIPSSTEAAYQELVGSQVNNFGRLFDPISRPGSWGSSTFRFIHTQDPAGAGGMDDRFDQLLVTAGLIDASAMDYIGNPAIPYSNSTWNDPNHSYRSWGNDGSSYNTTLAISGNTMVGSTIAQALFNSCDGQGHLPVFMDLKVPPRAAVSTVNIDFGKVPQYSRPPRRLLSISNPANTTLWTPNGIAQLRFTLGAAPAGFSGTAGTFNVNAAQAMDFIYSMDTSVAGPKSGTLIVTTNSPDEPTIQINFSGMVRRGIPPMLGF